MKELSQVVSVVLILLLSILMSCSPDKNKTESSDQAVEEAQAPQESKIVAIDDAVIMTSSKDGNMGLAKELIVSMNNKTSTIDHVLVKFPKDGVGNLEAGSKIFLNLYFNNQSAYGTENAGKQDILIQLVDNSWNQGVVTWNTAPKVLSEERVMISENQFTNNNATDIDITNLYRLSDNFDTKNISIKLSHFPIEGFAKTLFCSIEDTDVQKHPSLTVVRI